jgi:hypothetical protein
MSTQTRPDGSKTEVNYSPIVHASSHVRQLDDGNEVYDYFSSLARDVVNSTDEQLSADNPYHLGEIELEWIPGQPTVHLGMMSTKVGYGTATSGDIRRWYDIQFQFYTDSTCTERATLPGGNNKVVLEARRQGQMTNLSGHPFRGHPDFDGDFHDGTVVKMDVSYAQTPREAKERTASVLDAACEKYDLSQYVDPDAPQFYMRSSNPEVHVRTDMDETFVPIEETMKTLGRLLCVQSTGHITQRGEFRRGSRDGWHIHTDNFAELGFEDELPSACLDESLSVSDEYLKLYRHPIADNFSDPSHEKHYFYHPKLELEMEMTFPEEDWETVIARAEELLVNVLTWAGVSEDDLHADLWFAPEDSNSGPTSVTNHTIDFERLQEYWNDPRTRQSIAATMYESQTASYRDVLHVVRQHPGGVCYDLIADETGLTERRVREIVAEFVDMKVLRRERSVVTVVEFANEKAATIVEEETSKNEDNTPAERDEKLNKRAAERKQKRTIHNIAAQARDAAREAKEEASTLPGYKTAQKLLGKAKSLCKNAKSVSDAEKEAEYIKAEAEDVATEGTPEGRGGDATDANIEATAATDGGHEWQSLRTLGLDVHDLTLVASHDSRINVDTIGLRDSD